MEAARASPQSTSIDPKNNLPSIRARNNYNVTRNQNQNNNYASYANVRLPGHQTKTSGAASDRAIAMMMIN